MIWLWYDITGVYKTFTCPKALRLIMESTGREEMRVSKRCFGVPPIFGRGMATSDLWRSRQTISKGEG
jgi:hypothetical protein